jgi:hypothetical protein
MTNHVHQIIGRGLPPPAQLFGAVTENPAGAGFVDGPPHYLYGSARDYARPDVFVWLIHPRKPEGLPHDRHKSRFAETCASRGMPTTAEGRMLLVRCANTNNGGKITGQYMEKTPFH